MFIKIDAEDIIMLMSHVIGFVQFIGINWKTLKSASVLLNS